MEHNYSEFTEVEYRRLLQMAKRNFQFITYKDIRLTDKAILWRHDVDISMHRARALASIEKEEDVIATYFIYPHSEFYNLFEKEIFQLVNEIKSMGHQIGLHFDSHFYNISSKNELIEKLIREKSLLEDLVQSRIDVFSFHNNNTFTLGCEEWEYGGMINTYANYFKTEVGYCSDSHGIWRFSKLSDVLNKAEHNRLQVLTHPEWWQKEAMSPRDRVSRCINKRAQKCSSFYDKILEKMGRPNIK